MKAALTFSCSFDDGLDHFGGDLHSLGIEADEFFPSFLVGKRKLDGLVDSPWPGGQRSLEGLGPVGGEDEQDVRHLP